MSIETIVSHFKKRDLSGEEIQKLIGKPPVLYSDLRGKTLSQLFGKENYFIVLYQTSSRTTGHYVAITKSDSGLVRYADSYGIPNPDTELQYTPYDQVLPKYLSKLLDGVDFESNRVDYQAKKSVISTCGRYSSLFCLFRNLTLSQIHEMYKMGKSAFLNDTDNLVTILTLIGLNDIQSYLLDIPRGV